MLLAATLLFTAACAAKPIPAATTPTDEGVRIDYSMDYALVDLTGVRLGMSPEEVTRVVDGPCVPLRRQSGRSDGGVTELFCTYEDGEGKNRLRVGFSNPDDGQKAWRIYLNHPGPNTRQAPVIQALEEKFGPPRGEQKPLEIWWRDDLTTLRVFGQRDGLRVELWDRSLSR